jgi:hypothetical protein
MGRSGPEREVNHSPPSTAELQESEVIPLLPQSAFMAWAGATCSFLWMFTKMYWVVVNFLKIDTVKAILYLKA